MRWDPHISISIGLCLQLLVQNVIGDNKWTHHIVLDKQNRFHLFWEPLDDEIKFEIQVKLGKKLHSEQQFHSFEFRQRPWATSRSVLVPMEACEGRISS